MLERQCKFIDACKVAGVAAVKFSGKESGIGLNAQNFRFTRMHEEIERYLESSGLAWTHLRPSQFMHVDLREVQTTAAKSQLLPPLADVKLLPIDIAYVEKVAFAIPRQVGYDHRSFEMTGPQCWA